MKRYIFNVKERNTGTVTVWADDEDEARELAESGEGTLDIDDGELIVGELVEIDEDDEDDEDDAQARANTERNAFLRSIREGMLVYWHDPANETSGDYTVWYVPDDPDEIDEYTIVLIANEVSEAEVTVSELRPVYRR